MTVEYMPVKSIIPYERNAKMHSDEQVERIANSISEFGWQQPLVVDSNNVVIIGHGRLLAAKLLNLETVPVVKAVELSEEQVKALRLADNRVAKAKTDAEILGAELASILNIDMDQFGFNLNIEIPDVDIDLDEDIEDDLRAGLDHNVFENQNRKQFPITNYWGIPEMSGTSTVGKKFIRFADWNECKDPQNYIAHFYYDDFKFIAAWRDPDKYIDRLRNFKAVVSPDFSLYTDFPRALQMLSCYRRQWCGAYWQSLGIDVIPDVVWGDEESFKFCFEGIPSHSTVAVSSVGVKADKEWNNQTSDLFKRGYDEMLNRLEPTAILYYGDMIDGLEGNIIRIPSFYEQRRESLNEKAKRKKDGTR